MTDAGVFLLTLVAALGCGLIAGVFFAFSSFVMRALSRLPPAQGIAAMQAINVTVINPYFMTVFFGTAAACAVLVASSLLSWQERDGTYILIGSVCYLVGTILVTVVFNVPRNDALAKVRGDSAEGAKLWSRYVVEWTRWNHVRTVASFAAATMLTIAL
jgi:uncharacterized membrane protein